MVTRHAATVSAFGVRVRNPDPSRGALRGRDRPPLEPSPTGLDV